MRKKKTKKKVVIEYAKNGNHYCAGCDLLPGLLITKTGNFEQFKKQVYESIKFYIECSKSESEEYDKVFDGPYTLVFKQIPNDEQPDNGVQEAKINIEANFDHMKALLDARYFTDLVNNNVEKIKRLHILGVLSLPGDKVRDYHVGSSNYSNDGHIIEPWSIWLDYGLNSWDNDIIKRILRSKTIPGMTSIQSRMQDYEKIKHICDERIRQLKLGFDPTDNNH